MGLVGERAERRRWLELASLGKNACLVKDARSWHFYWLPSKTKAALVIITAGMVHRADMRYGVAPSVKKEYYPAIEHVSMHVEYKIPVVRNYRQVLLPLGKAAHKTYRDHHTWGDGGAGGYA